MYARYERRHLAGTRMEAKLLVELLMGWTVLLQSSPDSFDSVRELGRRIKVLLEKGRSVLLAILVYLSFDRSSGQAVREGLWKRNLERKKRK